MDEEQRPPVRRADDPHPPPSKDGPSSFAVWSRTTMLGDEDDVEPGEHGVVLRGID